MKYLSLYIALIFNITSFSQELPPIEFFAPNQYGAENQNWSISQSKNKNIYIANNKGLLEFNGASWLLYPSPNETIIRSVKVVNDTIYTGCYMDFGYWKKNTQGFLEYVSLTDKLNIQLEEDEQIWNILEVDNWILFQSLSNIYILNRSDQSVNKITSSTTITKIYKLENNIYFQRLGEGIFKIENGSDVLVFDDIKLKENTIVNIFRNKDNFIFVTQDNGLLHYREDRLDTWNIQANPTISKMTVYNSIQLNNGDLVLGTISNGIIIVDKNGKISYAINQDIGLGNNTILSLFEDMDNNIWLGLDKGVNCIEMGGALSIYKDTHGELGTIYTSMIFDNNLYLGTNQGLFYKEIDSNKSFELIDGSQGQVWCLAQIDDMLFCGHNLGTFSLQDNQFIEVASVPGTWGIKKINGREDLLIQGNYNGLNILEKKNGSWQFKNKIRGFDNSSRYFEFLNNYEILVNHEYKGVFTIKTDSSYTQALKVEKNSIDKGLYSSLIKYNDTIFYANKKGIYKYDQNSESFIKDSILSQAYDEQTYSSGKLIKDWDGNSLWSFSKNDLITISKGRMSNIPVIEKTPLPDFLREDGPLGFENILKLDEKKYLLGNSSGYIIIDLDKFVKKEYQLHINSIKLSSLKNESIYLDKSGGTGEFKNRQNNIEFSFNVAEYDKYIDSKYQHRLIGYDDEWSDWSKNYSVAYKNLSGGNYTFQVRARIGNTLAENVESYSFYIKKPFYLTTTALVIYSIGGLLILFFIHTLNRRHFKNQRKKVLEKTQREIALKELENTKQKISFKNKSLEQDISNKNRELAISTMSLIKKNEFLNDIKRKLKEVKSSNEIKSIINTIDSNLNNTDDWNLFEEAFNNADKDFLKKVKQKHQILTPNDLRLCAYLRLNLSSKEIAPLLNITIRSVEIRRYRLRKKINLDREVNLNDYFISL